jgi:phage baseplate assembly protein W
MVSSFKSSALGIDAALPLERSDSDFFYTLTKNIKDNTKQNVKMLFFTAPGERIMFPNYGVGLRNFLFENSPELDIKNRIRSQVRTYLNNKITILELNVEKGKANSINKTGQPNTLTVEMTYQINGYNIRDTVIAVENLPQ